MARPLPFTILICLLCVICGKIRFTQAAEERKPETEEPKNRKTPSAARPNILFIIADDLGWADVGYHGSEIDTPNIDRLAREGVILEQHYVTPMCSSTRACLQSGRYSTRFGLDSATNDRVFPPGMTTLASALKDAGYQTAITGKWHLGSKPEWGPLQYGFDQSHGSLAGGVDQYSHLYKKGEYQTTWHRNDVFIDEEGHTTDLFTRQAVRWIEADRGDKPFFIQVAFTAVHIPIQEPDDWVAPYNSRITDESRRRYAACATHMDHAVGEMVEALDRSGRRTNTLIVFTSDNGGSGPWKPAGLYPGTYEPSPVLGNNKPLRGRKGTIYEGGIRVPAFANWPGRLSPLKLNLPVHIVDWMPTLLNLTGYPFPASLAEDLRWDGRDIWPLLAGIEKFPESRILYFKRGNNWALRKGRWKLVQTGSEKTELFDLDADPNEVHNLATDPKYDARVAQLRKLLTADQALDKSGSGIKMNGAP